MSAERPTATRLRLLLGEIEVKRRTGGVGDAVVRVLTPDVLFNRKEEICQRRRVRRAADDMPVLASQNAIPLRIGVGRRECFHRCEATVVTLPAGAAVRKERSRDAVPEVEEAAAVVV